MNKYHNINIKTGDTVKIISGKDKGKIGQVTKVIYKSNSVIVENINMKIKHIKPQQAEQQGEIKNISKPIHTSNIKLYTEK